MVVGTLEGGKDEEVPVQPIGSVIETAAVEAVGIVQNLPDEGVYLDRSTNSSLWLLLTSWFRRTQPNTIKYTIMIVFIQQLANVIDNCMRALE